MKKARCFISYCSEDAKPEFVGAIVKHLTELAKRKSYNIEFLFDKELTVGNDLNKFMDEIDKVDSIIVICTPAYKKKYLNENNEYITSGVYKECKLMKERIERREKSISEMREDITDINFGIFPLVLDVDKTSGNSSDSIPDFLESLVREKINKIKFEIEGSKQSFTKKYTLTQQSKDSYKKIFLDCIAETCVIHSGKSEYLDMSMSDKLQNLIYNQKAEYAPVLTKPIFVNTFYFEQIRSQESYILIGRKGSGKTTTKTYFYENNKEKYKGVIELKIDELRLQEIYSYLFDAPYDANNDIKKDIEDIFTYETVIQYIWIVYVFLYSIYLVACEYKRRNNSLSPTQKRSFKSSVDFINEILQKIDSRDRYKNGKNISNTLYNFALSNVYKFFINIIDNSRDDERFFSSDIQAQISTENLLSKVIGQKIIERFYKGLSECKKRILFTLDGFDVASDIFRKQSLSSSSSDQVKKALFEIRWISSLMELVQDIKGMPNNELYKLLDICFLLPKDLFMEILDSNRDKYKYSSRFCEISWSGMELAIMVRKRLEALNNFPLSKMDKTKKLPEEILDMMWEKAYKSIPKEITIKTASGREYYVDIFLYMLRYSFWRPRDILLSLCRILEIFYSHSKTGIPINEETIKITIKAASISIVNSEFYNEFGTMWKNIKDCISQFAGSTLVLSEEELKNIILSNKFQIDLDADMNEIKEYKDKVRFLYEIGFLGIFVNDHYSKEYQMVTQQGFSFSEGMSCLRGFLGDDFDGCRFIINPVFIETLHLKINTNEYVGIQSWDILRELERRIQIKMKTDCFGSNPPDKNKKLGKLLKFEPRKEDKKDNTKEYTTEETKDDSTDNSMDNPTDDSTNNPKD